MKKCEDLDFVSNFCEYIKLGMSISAAAKGIGLSKVNVLSWIHTAEEQLKENPDAKTPETNFYNSVKNAEREFESTNLNIIKGAANKGDWKAAAWLLERRRAEDYALKTDMNIGAKNNESGTTKITVEYVDPKKDDARVTEMERQLETA